MLNITCTKTKQKTTFESLIFYIMTMQITLRALWLGSNQSKFDQRTNECKIDLWLIVILHFVHVTTVKL